MDWTLTMFMFSKVMCMCSRNPHDHFRSDLQAVHHRDNWDRLQLYALFTVEPVTLTLLSGSYSVCSY